ncbi:MAG: hypothetical protein HY922_09445 [Elusimicrobia bacterium]|nr:hypothetical protein [Elusimicrobiota bacterium]
MQTPISQRLSRAFVWFAAVAPFSGVPLDFALSLAGLSTWISVVVLLAVSWRLLLADERMLRIKGCGTAPLGPTWFIPGYLLRREKLTGEKGCFALWAAGFLIAVSLNPLVFDRVKVRWALETRDWRAAAAGCLRVIQKSAGGEEALADVLGAANLHLKDYDGALRWLKIALERQPEREQELSFQTAAVYHEMQAHQEAVRTALHAMEKYPYGPYTGVLSQIAAHAYCSLGDISSAARYAAQAAQGPYADAAAHWLYGFVLSMKGEIEPALRELAAASASAKTPAGRAQAEYLLGWTKAFQHCGDPAPHFEKAARDGDAAVSALAGGYLAVQDGDLDEAERRLLRLKGQALWDASFLKGFVLEYRGEWQSAMRSYEKAFSLCPCCAEAYVGAAHDAKELGLSYQAQRYLDAALSINPRHPLALREKAALEVSP